MSVSQAPPSVSQVIQWLPSWPWIIGFVVLSLFVSNFLAFLIERLRFRRIKYMSQQLSKHKGTTIPVTIITGFLGSGKTTLLNHIFHAAHDLRILIIENEVGSISIDHQLIDTKESDIGNNVIVYNNGCMCCSSGGPGNELERVLTKLLELIDQKPFDYVLVETSGLADPAPIMQTFFQASTTGRFVLDGVVTVVDVKNIHRHLKGEGYQPRVVEAERQVAYADCLILNKTDLVTAAELEDVKQLVLTINATACMYEAQYGKAPVDKMLRLHAFDSDRMVAVQKRLSAEDVHAHSDHVSSYALEHAGHVDVEKFKEWIRTVLNAGWENLFRVKGVLSVAGVDRRYIVQGTHAELIGEYDRDWRSTDDRKSQLVFIGRHLNPEQLQAGFDSICIPSGTSSVGKVSTARGPVRHRHATGAPS